MARLIAVPAGVSAGAECILRRVLRVEVRDRLPRLAGRALGKERASLARGPRVTVVWDFGLLALALTFPLALRRLSLFVELLHVGGVLVRLDALRRGARTHRVAVLLTCRRGALADPDRHVLRRTGALVLGVVTDRDLVGTATARTTCARAREDSAVVDPDVTDEHRLLLVGEEPAAVDHELDSGHRAGSKQRRRAGVSVALRVGLDLRRVPATRIVVADRLPLSTSVFGVQSVKVGDGPR